MTKAEFAARLKRACASVLAAEDELTEIDSRFGDADHGLTMAKIAGAISTLIGGRIRQRGAFKRCWTTQPWPL